MPDIMLSLSCGHHSVLTSYESTVSGRDLDTREFPLPNQFVDGLGADAQDQTHVHSSHQA
jgi:hypothetical protein